MSTTILRVFLFSALCAFVLPGGASAALNTVSVSVDKRIVEDGIVRQDVSFESTGSGRVTGEIIAPENAAAPHAAVLFVHWLGDAKTTNHTEFEPDALQLAHEGMTSLLIDAMWAKPGWFESERSTATDYGESIVQVNNLRRSLDILSTQPNVDPNRIAYVGHDFGAMYGAILSGTDTRPKCYVLMAGTTTFSEWYLLGKKPRNIKAYIAQMKPLDPLAYLAKSKAQAFMFQFAKKDPYITPLHETQFFQAAPEPRAMYVYQTGHALAVPEARADRLAWLRLHL